MQAYRDDSDRRRKSYAELRNGIASLGQENTRLLYLVDQRNEALLLLQESYDAMDQLYETFMREVQEVLEQRER